MMWFLNPALPGWYSERFRIVTASGTNVVIAYLNATVSFITLLTSRLKAWKNSFMTDKSFENFFFFWFLVIKLALQKRSNNDFSSSTNVSRRKASKYCFQLSLHEKDHQQLLYQFLDELWNVCILLWICSFCRFFYYMGVWYSLSEIGQQILLFLSEWYWMNP